MKKVVIIVDDDLMVLNYYTRLFTMKGYSIITFTNPIDCYQYINNKQNCHNILCAIIDLKLNHEWSGYSLASAINLINPKISLIAISGYIYDFDRMFDFYQIFKYAFNKSDITNKELIDVVKELEESSVYDHVQTF